VLLGHRLAVLLMVLAIGAQVAPRLAPHNGEAEKYHQLARAALAGARIVDQPTTRAVQALVSLAGGWRGATLMRAPQYLMVFYQFLEDPFTSTSNARWTTMGYAPGAGDVRRSLTARAGWQYASHRA
jgi:hypothetical protein